MPFDQTKEARNGFRFSNDSLPVARYNLGLRLAWTHLR
jgi:hypothetical protein